MQHFPSNIPPRFRAPVGAVLCAILSACGSTPDAAEKLKCNYFNPSYAQGFCIDTADGRKILTVSNPYQKAVSARYAYTLDTLPARRVICMSTTHIGLLALIGKTDAIVGVSGARYVYNPDVRSAFEQGEVAEVGYESQLDIERILHLQPDAILAYGVYNEFEATADKLRNFGLNVIYIGEYVEPHPLGKAEWAVAVAALFHCETAAIDTFRRIADEYAALKDLLPPSVPKVKVLLNAPWNEAWFMPSQHSVTAQYLCDAGGESVMPLHAEREAFPENIEYAFTMAHDAQLWLNCGSADNLVALRQMHPLIPRLAVCSEGLAYNHNKRSTPQGGSDFFESGAASPHIVLKDLIRILHPDLLPDYTPCYYHSLK